MSDSFERSQVKLPLLGERAGVRASLSQTELLVPRCFSGIESGIGALCAIVQTPEGPFLGNGGTPTRAIPLNSEEPNSYG